jgi:hypothetical protein
MNSTLVLLLCALPAAAVTLDSRSALVIDPREPAPLRKAAADLESDLRKVFGTRAPGGRSRIVVSLAHNAVAGVARPAAPETLHIQAAGDDVVLTGADLRGAIYAVYEFSQRFLGVDPFWYWTDHEPARRTSVTVPPSFRLEQGPAIRYRGWFINDEDLLTGWKPGAADKTGIALEVWDKVFEALLRLKGNMIVPGTFIFPYEPQVRAAGERGLIVTQHHIEVLGLNTWRWPEDKPYSIFSHPKLLESAWRNAMRQYAPGQEVIWTLGYRGRHDRPFWVDDKASGPDEASRARTIRGAIDKQIEIVRGEHRNPYFLMNAWMEAVPLVQKGLLQIPSGITLVWPDGGNGLIRDGGAIARGQGVYYHTAMLSGRHNQLTEMVPPDRIRREIGRAVRAGATEYLLDNTSDVRPVTMTTRALMEMSWNPAPWMAEGRDEAAAYIERWSREEFGAKAGPAVAACYRAYFAAPARFGKAEDDVMADNLYHTLARTLARQAAGEKGVTGRLLPGFADLNVQARGVVSMCREADARWSKLDAMQQRARTLVPAARRDFFQSHVLTQTAVHRHANRMLMAVAEAASAEKAARPALLRTALAELDAQLAALRAAEYGKWSGFYRGELFVNLNWTADMFRWALASLSAGAATPAPTRPDGYTIIKAYQGDQRTPVD